MLRENLSHAPVVEGRRRTVGSEPEAPVPFRGGGFAPKAAPLAAPAAFLIIIALWWAASFFRWVDPIALPRPERVAAALIDLAGHGELWTHVGASLQRLGIGWTIGASCGAAVGFLIGLASLARSAALPIVSAIFATPKIALLPLFIVWFGIGEASKVATIAVGVFSPMAIAAFGGVDSIDRNLIRMAQSFNVPTSLIVRRIVAPGALPALFSGARISAAIGIVLLTAAEMIGAQKGIGVYIITAGNLMRTDQLVAGVLLLATVGLIVGYVVSLAERLCLRWR